MPTTLEEMSTITAKGQTTIPKVVRQILGIDTGGKIVFRIEDGRAVQVTGDPDGQRTSRDEFGGIQWPAGLSV